MEHVGTGGRYNIYDDPNSMECQLLKRWQDRQAG